jgi:predicted metal-dependent hydrolase
VFLAKSQKAKQRYEINSLADNQVQSKTSDFYRKILNALAEKRAEFHAYNLKEERSYRVVLKSALRHQPSRNQN